MTKKIFIFKSVTGGGPGKKFETTYYGKFESTPGHTDMLGAIGSWSRVKEWKTLGGARKALARMYPEYKVVLGRKINLS